MPKNAFLSKIKNQKNTAYTDGIWYGMRIGFNIVAIALNHVFGFGEERLSRLESKVQELVDEIVDTNDPVVTEVRITRAIKQIRGEHYNE